MFSTSSSSLTYNPPPNKVFSFQDSSALTYNPPPNKVLTFQDPNKVLTLQDYKKSKTNNKNNNKQK